MGTPPGSPTSVDELLRPAAERAVARARQIDSDDPPGPVPRGLRPFLSFKRLPDRALAATRRVLDDDEAFRVSVREATSEEEVGRASWIFLDRPPGWEQELDELSAAVREAADNAREAQAESRASRRLRSVEAGRRRAEDEAVRLRSLLADAKDQLAAERRFRSRAESDAGRVRRRLEELEARADKEQARMAELEAALARGAAAETGPAGKGESEHGPQIDEPAVTHAGVEMDAAALAEAVAAGADAASELATILGDIGRRLDPLLVPPPPPPPPPTASPGVVGAGRPVELPPAVLEDSAEAAEFIVRVPGILILVDGYNVTKLARPELTLPEQRRWLADAALELAARSGARLEIVFDGSGEQERAPADRSPRSGVQVRFTPSGTEADDLLLDLVESLGPAPAVVASDDRAVQHGARRLGANVITSSQLLMVLRRPPVT